LVNPRDSQEGETPSNPGHKQFRLRYRIRNFDLITSAARLRN
jgi:hypothetical protein